MPPSKPILIACPQYRITVRGTYQRADDGTCPVGPYGDYVLDRVRCSQYGGRCMQTLCALHRYNNRGPGSWYPEIILARPERTHTAGRKTPHTVQPGGDGALPVEL